MDRDDWMVLGLEGVFLPKDPFQNYIYVIQCNIYERNLQVKIFG